jgi:tetratricopeptide (TPR) repeat protein
MVMVALSSPARLLRLAATLSFLLSLVLSASAQDKIVLTSGSSLTGQITGVSGGQVAITSRSSNGGQARLTYNLNMIQSVTMAPPDVMKQLSAAPPATVISLLEPVVKEYAGLPADWVVDAMAKLADAYDAAGQAPQAAATYAQINQLYPNSPYQSEAIAGNAKLALNAGKVDDALALVTPLIQKANQDLAPSPADGRLYARAFLVYGQALEAQKKFPQALEAYLTVKTMFYQNPELVTEAEQRAQALQAQNPGVAVD